MLRMFLIGPAVCVLAMLSSFSVCVADRLQPEDIVYKGAFRLPNEYNNSFQWEYGGYALAFRADGDPTGEGDGYPGSLYSAGKQQGAGVIRDVSEFSIPVPKISASLENLNTASTLQTFGDITNGLFDATLGGQELNRVQGLACLEAQPGQSSGKLYWSIWSSYNVGGLNLPSQGYSDLTISSPNEQGVWKLEGYTSKYVSGYLFDIPRTWADKHIGGKYLATGVARAGGAYSRGPALFAIAPYRYSKSNPPQNGELPTTPLIFYNSEHDNYPNYEPRDSWGGASWITAGSKEAVVFVGTKCLGETCYGTGENCGDPCSPYKGYHCYPRELQMVLYDVSVLEAVADGTKNPWEPLPYATINLASLVSHFDGCSQNIGVTYDRTNRLLYLNQFKGDSTKPLIHVFGIEEAGNPRPQAPVYLRVNRE